MSKSYDNTIPMFCRPEELKKHVMSIVTDSRAPGEAKSTEGSALFQIYQAFASAEETAAMRQAFADGIGWGEAKARLHQRMEAEIAPLREKYDALMARPEQIEAILQRGAERLRERYARPLLARVREAVGLRHLARMPEAYAAPAEKAVALPVFKQYREADGLFYFKLSQGESVLLQSRGFAQPREAGQCVAALKAGNLAGLGTDYHLLPELTPAQLGEVLTQLAGKGE